MSQIYASGEKPQAGDIIQRLPEYSRGTFAGLGEIRVRKYVADHDRIVVETLEGRVLAHQHGERWVPQWFILVARAGAYAFTPPSTGTAAPAKPMSPEKQAAAIVKAAEEQAAKLLAAAAEAEEKAAVEAALKAERDAVAAAKLARQQQLQQQRELAVATHALLTAIVSLDSGADGVTERETFAQFRKELQPLAKVYGYKIVLVGNKSKATLVNL
jgi:hypothetical protein